MKKIFILVTLIFGAGSFHAQTGFGEVMGEVVDTTGASVYDAHVFIDDVGGQRYQAKTDYEGRFRISGIPSGDYQLFVRQLKDTLAPIPVSIPRDGFHNCGKITFNSEMITLLGDVIVSADPGIRLVDGFLPVNTMKAAEIQESAVKFDLEELINSMSSEIQLTNDGDLVIRGSRPGDMLYLIDGIKASEIGNMPSVAIGSLTVYAGGIPAKYGDTLGGVIAMETQSYFDLYRAWKSKQLKAGK